jgi:hypothetical protein
MTLWPRLLHNIEPFAYSYKLLENLMLDPFVAMSTPQYSANLRLSPTDVTSGIASCKFAVLLHDVERSTLKRQTHPEDFQHYLVYLLVFGSAVAHLCRTSLWRATVPESAVAQ